MDRINTASMRALRGESAYEVAVRNGFTGTVEEWLATLGGPVSSVNTRIGHVVLSKGDVGLGNADNTSDVAKPISTATQTALDAKAGAAPFGAQHNADGTHKPHPHAASDVTSGVLNNARLPTHQMGWTFGETIAGRYFGPHNTLLGNVAATLPAITATVNRTYGVPLYIPTGMTLDAIRFEVVTAVAASSAIAGIYNATASGFADVTLLAQSAAIPTDTTGFKDAAISLTTAGGPLVWLGIVCSHAIAFRGFSPALTTLQTIGSFGNATLGAVFRESASFAISPPNATFTLDHALLQVRTA